MSASRLEKLLWPRWLPESLRMPVIAQVTGAVALTALIMGPWWSRVDAAPLATKPPATAPTAVHTLTQLPGPVSPVSPSVAASAAAASRPAHLNLDLRHTFGNVDLTVLVDGKRVLDTKLDGSGKKFKMFGRRTERSFTRTLDLEPGVRLVRVSVKSAEEKFAQSRVERFELAPASVASLRITADKAVGLVATADRPAGPATAVQLPAPAPLPPPPSVATVTAASLPIAAPAASAGAPAQPQRADPLGELLSSLRSMLIAIAGFVASTSTGFLIQEFLRSKRSVFFAAAAAGGAASSAVAVAGDDEDAPPPARRRRSSAQTTAAAE